MKRINYILSTCLIILAGCSDFLKEVDQDKLIPSETEHYAAVLLKEFSNRQAYFEDIDFMTDNVSEYGYSSDNSRSNKKPVYTWQIEIELDENGERLNNNTAWEGMYNDIATANYVIDNIDKCNGSLQEKKFVKGEAYFVRAWSFFELTNLYGAPYTPETAKTELGVPLKTGSGISQTYDRASLADTYTQIVTDLNAARKLIEESSLTKSKYHPSVSACDLMLSRVYLYMQNWKKAEEAAGRVIAKNALSRMTGNTPYVTEERSDILYTSLIRISSEEADVYSKGWKVSDELIDLYDTDDIRLKAFFTKINGKLDRVYYPLKHSNSFTNIGYNYLRVAEAYLNRAEARFHLDGDAAGDLQTLLESRYANKSSIRIATGEELLVQILTERRKELCFEGHHRWFDLRRMSDRPAIIHEYTLTDASGNYQGKQAYTLFPDDRNYTLPIPLKERENNPLIRNNQRYEKIPENI